MYNDRFATTEEIKRSLTPMQPQSTSAGPILFYRNHKGYMDTKEGHTMTLGTTGSGKSRRLLEPMLHAFIEAGESFACIDPKGEHYYQTGAKAAATHRVICLNFRDVFHSTRWNPLSIIYQAYLSKDPSRIQTAQEELDKLRCTLFPIIGNDPFWPNTAGELFIASASALFYLCKTENTPELVTLANVHALANSTPSSLRTLSKDILSKNQADPFASVAYRMFTSYLSSSYATASSILGSFNSGMSIFLKNTGLTEMLSQDEVCMDELDVTEPLAIYVIIPDETEIYDSLAGVFISQLLVHFVQLAENTYHGQLPRRMNIGLEELGNVAKALPGLDHLMAASRSRNIRIHCILQSLSQLEDIYGKSKASTIYDNVSVFIVFRFNEWNSLVEFSNRCGQHDIETRTGLTQRENLIGPSAIQAMETGQALVLISGRIRFVTWLPDFTEMFDCSNWEAPQVQSHTSQGPIDAFDLEKILRKHEKGHQKQHHFSSMHYHFSEPENDDIAGLVDLHIPPFLVQKNPPEETNTEKEEPLPENDATEVAIIDLHKCSKERALQILTYWKSAMILPDGTLPDLELTPCLLNFRSEAVATGVTTALRNAGAFAICSV